ncbi:hypothetical protein HK101_004929, partial [Irineochytrium annulatum]
MSDGARKEIHSWADGDDDDVEEFDFNDMLGSSAAGPPDLEAQSALAASALTFAMEVPPDDDERTLEYTPRASAGARSLKRDANVISASLRNSYSTTPPKTVPVLAGSLSRSAERPKWLFDPSRPEIKAPPLRANDHHEITLTPTILVAPGTSLSPQKRRNDGGGRTVPAASLRSSPRSKTNVEVAGAARSAHTGWKDPKSSNHQDERPIVKKETAVSKKSGNLDTFLESVDQGNVKAVYKAFTVLEEMLKKRPADADGSVTDLDKRWRFAELARVIIVNHASLTQANDIEPRLWKTCFHSRIELMRSFSSVSASEDVCESWLALIDFGLAFYANLVAGIKAIGKERHPSQPRFSRCVGYMGDLARYKEILGLNPSGRKDYSVARKYYRSASLLAPSNGLYCNQLATLAAMEGRYLEALYEYVRSLNVKTPFLNAKDTVTLLFGSIERMVGKLNSQRRKGEESASRRVHDILSTHVSVERLPIHLNVLSKLLSGRQKATVVPDRFYFHASFITIANLTTVRPNVLTTTEELLELSMRAADMVMEAVLLEAAKGVSDAAVGARIWIGWLIVEGSIWFKLARTRWQGIWNGLRVLFKAITDRRRTGFVDEGERVMLQEDWVLRGFLPFKELHSRTRFDKVAIESGMSVDEFFSVFNEEETSEVNECREKALLSEIVQAFKGVDFLHIDVEKGSITVVSDGELDDDVAEEAVVVSKPSRRIDDDVDELDERGLISTTTACAAGTLSALTVDLLLHEPTESDSIRDLKSRLDDLNAKIVSRQVVAPATSSSGTSAPRKLDLNILKAKLLFDTNCYLGDFEGVKAVIDAGWTVIVPIAVIMELEGLQQTENDNRANAAVEAFEYLDSAFQVGSRATRPPNLQVVTAQCTVLPYLSIKTEQWGDGVRAVDDVLVRIVKTMENCVLVSEDVNLRLKARGADVATGGMKEVLVDGLVNKSNTRNLFILISTRMIVTSSNGQGIQIPSRAHDWSSVKVFAKGRFFTDEHGRSLMLRGVNLCGNSKLPTIAADDLMNHRSVSFVGRPFKLDEADEHFKRLRTWGLTFVRLLVTWESIEHAGPGKYDDEYIEYLTQILKRAQKFGIKCFIDPHQDTWSRFSGGSGAPGWTFEICGLNIETFQKVGAAHINNIRDYESRTKHMLWPTNYTKLASATMFTLFFAGEIFAPLATYEGENVGTYMQRHFIAAFTYLANRLKNCESVLGFELINEPHCGYIGMPSIHRFNPLTNLHFGPFPSALESFALGNGMKVEVDVYVRSWPLPTRRSGRLWMNEEKLSAWVNNRECIWKQHGVWDVGPDGKPRARIANYFAKNPRTQMPIDFGKDCYLPFFRKYVKSIHSVKPDLLLFFEPIPNEDPPEFEEEDHMLKNVVYAPHWYDLNTLFSKSFDGFMTHDVQGLARGKSVLQATYFGIAGAGKNYSGQLRNIVRNGVARIGQRPILLGECGMPMDINEKKAFETNDYTWHTKFLDVCISGMESNLINFTLWNYNPMNDNLHGDFWNGEDFSIFSPKSSSRSVSSSGSVVSMSSLLPASKSNGSAESSVEPLVTKPPRPKSKLTDITTSILAAITPGSLSHHDSMTSLTLPEQVPTTPFEITSAYFHEDPNEPEYHEAHHEGGRALDAIVRPFAAKVAGIPELSRFRLKQLEYTLHFLTKEDAAEADTDASPVARVTEIFIPNFHFGVEANIEVVCSDGEWKYDKKRQTLYWVYDPTYDADVVHATGDGVIVKTGGSKYVRHKMMISVPRLRDVEKATEPSWILIMMSTAASPISKAISGKLAFTPDSDRPLSGSLVDRWDSPSTDAAYGPSRQSRSTIEPEAPVVALTEPAPAPAKSKRLSTWKVPVGAAGRRVDPHEAHAYINAQRIKSKVPPQSVPNHRVRHTRSVSKKHRGAVPPSAAVLAVFVTEQEFKDFKNRYQRLLSPEPSHHHHMAHKNRHRTLTFSYGGAVSGGVDAQGNVINPVEGFMGTQFGRHLLHRRPGSASSSSNISRSNRSPSPATIDPDAAASAAERNSDAGSISGSGPAPERSRASPLSPSKTPLSAAEMPSGTSPSGRGTSSPDRSLDLTMTFANDKFAKSRRGPLLTAEPPRTAVSDGFSGGGSSRPSSSGRGHKKHHSPSALSASAHSSDSLMGQPAATRSPSAAPTSRSSQGGRTSEGEGSGPAQAEDGGEARLSPGADGLS